MFVGTGASAGAVNTSNGAQAAAITAIGGAAVEAGAALTAVITPGSITRSGALGGGSVLYRSILSLADQFGFAQSIDKKPVDVELGGNIILFSIGACQTAESPGDFFKDPGIENAWVAAARRWRPSASSWSSSTGGS